MDILKKEIKTIQIFAWLFICNIAMPICDAINVNHEQGNLAAAKINWNIYFDCNYKA